MDEKAIQAIQKRQEREKKLIIEQLRKTPIIQIACEKIGIARATFYRWRKEDSIFAKGADEALSEGKRLVNDMAESQLLSLIREENLGAIVFWLRNNHPGYGNKVEVMAKIQTEEKPLTPQQEQLIAKALKLISETSTEAKEGKS